MLDKALLSACDRSVCPRAMAKSSNADNIVARYIERVSELSQRRQQLPTQTELESLALELGLSKADLKLAQAEAKACRQRARTYCRVGRWEDAIAEFEGSALIPVTSPDILLDWAKAHKGRYEETGKKADRDQAQQLARQCLDIQPNFRAAAILLNELDVITPPSKGIVSSAKSIGLRTGQNLTDTIQPKLKGRVAPVLVGVVAIAGAAALGYLRAERRISVPQPAPQGEESNNTIASPPLPSASPAITRPNSPRTTSNQPSGAITIPAELKTGDGEPGLVLETRTSGLTRFSNGVANYRGQFMLVNQTQREISRTYAMLEYLDSDGTVIHSKPVKLLDSFQPVLRPGDRHPISVLDSSTNVGTLGTLASVRFTPNYSESTPAAASYPPAKVGKFTWGVSQPPGADIKIGIRHQTVNSYNAGASNYFKMTAEVTNTGTVNLKRLKLELDILDGQGQSIGTRPLLVSFGTRPPLLQGETRLVRTTVSIPRSPERYSIRVVDVEAL